MNSLIIECDKKALNPLVKQGVLQPERSQCWHIGWMFLLLFTIAGQGTIVYFVIKDLIYILSNVSSWPLYDHGSKAHGIFAIGKEAYGIVAVGQYAHGIVAIGQIASGIFSIGQLGMGLLFAFCQGGGGLGIAIGQGVVATQVPWAQIGFGLWGVGKVQIGFNILSSKLRKEALVIHSTFCVSVRNAERGLMGGIKYYHCCWPKEGKQWIANAIRSQNTEDVIQQYVEGSANKGYHGLDKLDATAKQEVIDRLVQRKEEFKRVVIRNFPEDL